MKRILVTGGFGFLGSHLLRHLSRKFPDAELLNLDRIDAAGSQDRVRDLDNVRMVFHDLKAEINNATELKLGREFDYIVHMAAGSHVDRSIKQPEQFVLDNVLGTANLLNWVRDRASCKRFLYFSTDEVFGPAPPGVQFDEFAAMAPNNPYAATKAGGELLCTAYVHQYGMPICVTHCTNAYGTGQDREKFIPATIHNVAADKTVQLHCNNAKIPASRRFLHTDDISRAVVTVLEKGGLMSDGETGKYNIGGALDLSVLDVAKMIAAQLGKELHYELVQNPANRPKPDQRYDLDTSRIQRLGWRPEKTFEEGLREIVEDEL